MPSRLSQMMDSPPTVGSEVVRNLRERLSGFSPWIDQAVGQLPSVNLPEPPDYSLMADEIRAKATLDRYGMGGDWPIRLRDKFLQGLMSRAEYEKVLRRIGGR